MKENTLSEVFMDENTFWHITSKFNIASISKHGLVPHDGTRNGKNRSAEDPVPRVFFSQGLEGVLGQANNTPYLINSCLKEIKRTSNGNNGKDIEGKIQQFFDNGKDNNGGFIDYVNFIKNNLFKDGINENLTEQELDRITYDIVKPLWENDICLKVNLREGIDYSWDDVNYNATGTATRPMTKKNMHTFEGHTIPTDQIEIITDEKGNPRTTWDVFKEMALYYKREHPDKEYLPVEEWQESGKTLHRKDFFSIFMEIEQLENATHLTLNKIGQQTKDNFVSHPVEAIEAIKVLDDGVRMHEEIKENQTRGEG